MRNSLWRLVTASGMIGTSLFGLLPGEGFAAGDLARGQEVELPECQGWLVEDSNWPALAQNAVYWFVHGIPTYPPGGHFRFRGEFPRARYMSWQNHDFFGNSTAVLADTDIVPDRGDNPFRPNTPYSSGSTYTVDLLDVPPEARPLPEPRPANVIYGGYRYDGSKTEYNGIAYRVYVPDLGTDSLGGVPRPNWYFVVDDPEKTSLEAIHDMCRKIGEIQEATTQLAHAVVRSDRPRSAELTEKLDSLMAEDSFTEAGTSPPLGFLFMDSLFYWAVPPDSNGRGLYVNAQSGYLQVYLPPWHDEVAIVRFKAPTFPDTQGIQGVPQEISGNEQLRYWSLCAQDTTAALATTGCLYDARVAPDGDGYVTVAFSDSENRPANAINWLPISGSIPGLILRHMQPNPSFAEALLYYDGDGTDTAAIAAHMGEYFPRVISCSKAEFESDRCGLTAGAQ
jgi:hypothetical protein